MRLRPFQELLDLARKAKQKGNKHEKAFAQLLRKFKISYQRQEVIVRFIVDFYLPDRNLIIEIDGPSHNSTEDYDTYRDNCLKTWGWNILHFTWPQMIDFERCLEQVLANPSTKANRKDSKLRLNKWNKAYHNGDVILNDPLEDYPKPRYNPLMPSEVEYSSITDN